jgi:hypothetical protein
MPNLALTETKRITVRRSLGIKVYRAGIVNQSMGARKGVGIGMSYRPARLHSLSELKPKPRLKPILGLLKSFKKIGLQVGLEKTRAFFKKTQPSVIYLPRRESF